MTLIFLNVYKIKSEKHLTELLFCAILSIVNKLLLFAEGRILNDAKNVLELNELWNKLDSNTIADNVEAALEQDGWTSFGSKMEKLSEITNSSRHAVYAWLNHGRTNVKIPFLKLCMIADALNTDITKLLSGGNDMFEKKFAVTKTIGNDEKILKYFGEDEKVAALSYGAEIAKGNVDGVITCILARFDKNGNKKNGECEVFEVWD